MQYCELNNNSRWQRSLVTTRGKHSMIFKSGVLFKSTGHPHQDIWSTGKYYGEKTSRELGGASGKREKSGDSAGRPAWHVNIRGIQRSSQFKRTWEQIHLRTLSICPGTSDSNNSGRTWKVTLNICKEERSRSGHDILYLDKSQVFCCCCLFVFCFCFLGPCFSIWKFPG